jgi:hypothetical protein
MENYNMKILVGSHMPGSAVFILISIMVSVSGCANLNGYFLNRANDFIDCFSADVGYGIGLDGYVKATDLVFIGVGASWTDKAGFKGRYIGTWKDGQMGLPFGQLMFSVSIIPSHAIPRLDVRLDDCTEPAACCGFLILPTCFIVVGVPLDSLNSMPSFISPIDVYIDHIMRTTYEKRKFIPGGFYHRSILFLPFPENIGGTPFTPFSNLKYAFSIDVGCTLGIVGIHAGFNISEFVDFITGFAGFDIVGDDAE